MNSINITLYCAGVKDSSGVLLPQGEHKFSIIRLDESAVEGEIESQRYHFSREIFTRMLTKPVKTCAICLEEIEGVFKTLPCKHSFHCGCIKTWLKRKSTCPVCRKRILRSEVYRVPLSRLRRPPSRAHSGVYRKQFSSRPNFLT